MNIEKRLEEHYNKIKEAGYNIDNILGIFLYGSQNYNCATNNSDVDTKAIIVPTLEEAILNKEWKVKELHLPNGEHCEVMDIRHFVDNLKKQNINFVETLFTDYCLLNPKYFDIWNKYFILNKEELAHYDMRKCVMSMCGQAIHTLKRNPTDGKQVGNAYRVFVTLTRYLCGNPYLNCIKLDDKTAEKVIEYKTSKTVDLNIAETLIGCFEGYKMAPDSLIKTADKDTLNILLDTAILELILKGR